MQLERLGAFHQTRLSFVRSIVRKVMEEAWEVECASFDLDAEGYGTCIYHVRPPDELYSMVIFSQPLEDNERTDRVIAEKWDLACVLCEGKLTDKRLAELRVNVPKQEAGRNQTDVLVLSRANKSTRNFDYVVDCLARGEQPNPEVLAKVGYIHRTTAVYGNGKFGVADYNKVQQRSAFATTFSAQMFAVFMIRHFSLEQIDHIASRRAPATAIPLNEEIKRYIGIGNATGLGMAPFLVKHPKLIHSWIYKREVAIARVIHTQSITVAHVERLLSLIDKATTHFQQTYTDDTRQAKNNRLICQEMLVIKAWLQDQVRALPATKPNQALQTEGHLWQSLTKWAWHHASLETQELINSLLVELYPELVDELAKYVSVDERYTLQPEASMGELKQLIETQYQWALAIDFNAPRTQHYFWYRSAEKEEPRLGQRAYEPGAEKEMSIGIGRAVQQLYATIQSLSAAELEESVIHFLLKYPTNKGTIRRIQALQHEPYSEIQSNLLDQSCLPIHLLRCKLACFGASKFDPKSDRWVRITLFQGAPLVSDIGQSFADDWCFPCMPKVGRG
ncbi:MAG: hypothetical protein AAF702_33205 [Chloroflexota bacterium]